MPPDVVVGVRSFLRQAPSVCSGSRFREEMPVLDLEPPFKAPLLSSWVLLSRKNPSSLKRSSSPERAPWGHAQLDTNDCAVPLLIGWSPAGGTPECDRGSPLPSGYAGRQSPTLLRPPPGHHPARAPESDPVLSTAWPQRVTFAVQQRDLAVYDALLGEERP
jgi:hypothetical protein